MGVKGLWKILEPVGRRVDIATLRGKTIAVDMSIWLVSFLHGMRDKDGNPVPNAHLLGTFRRLVKLLFNRIKPVFVFDGGAPILKRRTLLLRQQQRQRNEARHTQAVRRLLLQQLQTRGASRASSQAAAALPFSAVSTLIAGDDVEDEESDSNLVSPARPAIKHLRRAPLPTGPGASVHSLSANAMSGTAVAGSAQDRFASAAAFGDSDDSSGSGKRGKFDDSVPIVPDTPEDADLSVVASLPAHLQASYIDELKRKHRGATRIKLLPVAGDPMAFSQVQMSSFLNVAKFNTDVDRLNAQQAGSAGDNGKRIASEADRKYLLFDDESGILKVDASGSGLSNESSRIAADPMAFIETEAAAAVAAAGQRPKSPTDRQHLHLFEQARCAGGVRAWQGRPRGHRGAHVGPSRGEFRRLRGSSVVKRMEAASKDALRHIATIEGTDSDGGELLRQFNSLHKDAVTRLGSLAAPLPLEYPDLQKLSDCNSTTANSAGDIETSDDDSAQMLPKKTRYRSVQPDSTVADGHAVANAQAHHVANASVSGDSESEEGGFMVHCLVPASGTTSNIAWRHSSSPSVDSTGTASADKEDWEDVVKGSAGCDVVVGEDVAGLSAGDIEAAIASESPNASGPPLNDVSAASAGSAEGFSESPLPEASVHTVQRGSLAAAEAQAAVGDSADAGVQDAALTDAFELAGSMRGWAKHAFASALKGLGRSLPVASLSQHAQHSVKELVDNDSGRSIDDAADVTPAPAVDEAIGEVILLVPPSRADAATGTRASLAPTASRPPGPNPPPPASAADLAALEAAEAALKDDVRDAARSTGGEVTAAMTAEVIALLGLCGVPHVVAPMEAEAQCAALELLGVVQGVVSDDSDAFLFGSSCVYRNIFEDHKYVEEYRMSDVARELGLVRDDLIRLALLLGSDYTEGVKGVGPVNALEVLRAFPGDEGLTAFRDWLLSVHPDPPLDRAQFAAADPATAFKARHRAARRSWQVSAAFPSVTVAACYRHPTVREVARDGPEWAPPDLNGLRILCVERFGWPPERADAELLPLASAAASAAGGLRQAPMDAYVSRAYGDTDRAAKIRSARLRAAVEGITGSSLVETGIAERRTVPERVGASASGAQTSGEKKRRRRQPRRVLDSDNSSCSSGGGGSGGGSA